MCQSSPVAPKCYSEVHIRRASNIPHRSGADVVLVLEREALASFEVVHATIRHNQLRCAAVGRCGRVRRRTQPTRRCTHCSWSVVVIGLVTTRRCTRCSTDRSSTGATAQWNGRQWVDADASAVATTVTAVTAVAAITAGLLAASLLLGSPSRLSSFASSP